MVSFRWKLPRQKSYPHRSFSDTLKHTHAYTQLLILCVFICHTSSRRTDVVIGRGSFIAHVVLMRATSTRRRFVSPHFTKFALRPYQIKTYTLPLSHIIYNISSPNINHNKIILLPDLYGIISYYLIYLIIAFGDHVLARDRA